MAEQGWLAVELSEDAGGLGLGLVETVVLCEQLGRHVAPVPFLGTVLAGRALVWAVADGEAEGGRALGGGSVDSWIERLSTGAAVGAMAWSRRPGAVTALSDGHGGWTLRGRSDLVVYGPVADVVVVEAEADGAPALFALAPGDSERPGPEPAMDRTRNVGWLTVADRPALRLGGPGRAGPLLDRAATAISAEMLGAADRVLEMTVDYAKNRVQFGRPIGGFQAVKHRCADMLVDVEGMRSSTYYAGWAVGADDAEAPSGASGDGVGVAGPRGYRLHLGARPPPLSEAFAARPDELRRRRVPPRTAGADPATAGGVRPARALRAGRLRADRYLRGGRHRRCSRWPSVRARPRCRAHRPGGALRGHARPRVEDRDARGRRCVPPARRGQPRRRRLGHR